MRLDRVPRHWFAGLAVLPMLVWWLGWYPGFGHSDTLDQWNQLTTEVYHDHHPAIHTFYLDILSIDGTRPGLVTLVQILALGAVLTFAAKWLIRAGVPSWLAIGVVWLLALSPGVPPTTMALWKDIPFGLFFVWAWVELLALRVEDGRSASLWPWVRLGVALSGVWLFRANGPLTVLPVLLVIVWVYRRSLRGPALVGATLLLLVLGVTGPLYDGLEVQDSSIEPAQVFLPDVAASLVSNPDSFEPAELELVYALAPPEVWAERYDCYESNPLLFDPSFNHAPVRDNPGAYRDLVVSVFLRDPGSVLRHRLCAADFLYSPAQPTDAWFHRPPYDFPENEFGIRRTPISDRAFAVTDWYWRWAEVPSRLWLTWRPAIILMPALLATLFFMLPRGRRFILPSVLFWVHLANVAVTSGVQEVRYAYPLYLVGALTLTLLVPTFRRKTSEDATQTPLIQPFQHGSEQTVP